MVAIAERLSGVKHTVRKRVVTTAGVMPVTEVLAEADGCGLGHRS
jgi:hypothetical protein